MPKKVKRSALVRMSVANIGTVSGITQLVSEFDDKPKAQAWLDEG